MASVLKSLAHYIELWMPFLRQYADRHPDMIDSSSLVSLVHPEQEAALPVGDKRGLPAELCQTEDPLRNKIRFLHYSRTSLQENKSRASCTRPCPLVYLMTDLLTHAIMLDIVV